jgi:serine/threonine-protein kinase RsbW
MSQAGATAPPTTPDLELELPAKPQYVRAARRAVGALARMRDAQEELIEDIKLAVSEACTRAINCHEEAGSQEPVVLRAFSDRASLVVEVLDRGPDPERSVSGPPAEIDTGELPFESALAVPLIRGLVDEVALAPRPGGGSLVRMTVSLSPGSD